MKHYENLEEAMCRELEMLDKKYGGETKEMSPQDVERADILYHALKSAATYHAMKDAEEWEEEESGARGRSYARNGDGRSYARRRDSMGRFTSGRYDDGYSGQWPMYPRYPMSYGPDDRMY